AQVVDAVLADRGLTHAPSTGGQWADQLLYTLGGSLAALPLRDPAAMGVVRLLAPHHSERLEKMSVARLPADDLRLDQMPDRLRNAGLVAEGDLPAIPAAVATLVHARVLFVGTRVRCRSCSLELWRIVDELAMEIRCTGCRAPIVFDAL